jgi:transposase
MAGKSGLPQLILSSEQEIELTRLSHSLAAPAREVLRARILCRFAAGETVTEIARALNTTRPSVQKWVNKALAMGASAALKDTWHRPHAPVITEEAKAWVVHLACSKPKDHGYAAELWTRSLLAKHVRQNATSAGHPSLAKAVKATVHRILSAQDLHPERVRYYLEKRDPEFEAKMKVVLLVYQEIALQNEVQSGGTPRIITVSADQKPGLQALANTAPDLPPVAGKHPAVSRDHEYKRMGTCSILAALDLHDGHVTARVERRRRSREFIELLKDLDARYPAECTIRVVLDNHSSHISKETRAFLTTRPNRFEYVLTPKHGSWLNISRDPLRQNVQNFPAPYSRSVVGRTSPENSAGNRRDQCCAGRPPLEQIRRPQSSQSGNNLVKRYTSVLSEKYV